MRVRVTTGCGLQLFLFILGVSDDWVWVAILRVSFIRVGVMIVMNERKKKNRAATRDTI